MFTITQEDNGKKGRFLIWDNEVKAGEMTYTWAGETKFIIDHTEVNTIYARKGLGKKLVLKAVEFARKNQLKILPLCPFAKKEFSRNSEIQDVLF